MGYKYRVRPINSLSHQRWIVERKNKWYKPWKMCAGPCQYETAIRFVWADEDANTKGSKIDLLIEFEG